MSGQDRQLPGLMEGFIAIVRRDLLLAWKRPGDVLNPLFFFAMVASLFPLAAAPSPEQLMLNGPGVVWVAALLATLLSLNSLFLSDFEDGSLHRVLLGRQPLPLLGLGRGAAHGLLSGVPLVLVSPLIAVSYRMPADIVGVMMLTLALGTVSLSLLGAIGAALTVGLNRGNALLSLLIMPLAMPVLIFGARTVSLAATGDPYAAGIYFLAAYCMLALTLAPFATAAALKISNE